MSQRPGAPGPQPPQRQQQQQRRSWASANVPSPKMLRPTWPKWRSRWHKPQPTPVAAPRSTRSWQRSDIRETHSLRCLTTSSADRAARMRPRTRVLPARWRSPVRARWSAFDETDTRPPVPRVVGSSRRARRPSTPGPPPLPTESSSGCASGSRAASHSVQRTDTSAAAVGRGPGKGRSARTRMDRSATALSVFIVHRRNEEAGSAHTVRLGNGNGRPGLGCGEVCDRL